MKILITGFAGFVSRHFLNLLSSKDENSFVIGLDRNKINFDTHLYKNITCEFVQTDLKDKDALLKILQTFTPDYILHLASASSVSYSWHHPAEVFTNNNTIFLNLLEAAKEYGKTIRILSTGTADVYGITANEKSAIEETDAIHPANPYAAGKASQEMIAKIYADSFGIDIIQTRSFPHFGAYQKENFVLAKFAKALTLIKNNKQSPELITGNIDVIRDLTDVRDVAQAYYLLLKHGTKGELYNVCSGKGRSLRDALKEMQKQLSINVELKLDELLLRKGEIQSITGSNKKIHDDTGWQPTISFEQSIADLLEYWGKGSRR